MTVAGSGDFSVGLTGGIGSGKSTVADLFAERGVTLIDADLIAHHLTEPGGTALPAIARSFGTQFLQADGAMNRAMMRDRVFSDPVAKKNLEAILHPLIRQEVARAAAQATGLYTLFVVPLLVESGHWRERVTRILVVDCPEKLQIARVMQRNGLTEEQVHAIMATQATRAQRHAAADDLICNDGDTAALVPQVERLHALYCALAASP
ncbi:dephospho-CoA kinase [Actimicrobium sp. CCI2.3]|uniref:dephospho-CoA kinase n=1 Tax=Actimicrobium sp. CCI2.3 TaxID=3048616 RepID=UPI002AB58976|nr:dephospho-CoA kinase [Actimicrobium sp. CCI2.3]MDY7573561.1 dephospho-CoA kinase [Actimicrobium sp. CCI2.3]MEB0022074.1 dephospho-CoA kinase [Actimicrobium sp. CCI2.3]